MAARSGTTIIPLSHYTVALMLTKSKPALMSRREYFDLLASYMKDEPRSNDATATTHYVDEITMWHDAYTQSEETQLALRARILELERLLERLNGEKDPIPLTSTRKRRRKSNHPSEASGSRSQKKPMVAANAPAVDPHDSIVGGDIEDNERPAIASLGNPILHHLYILHQILAQETFEPSILAATLCHMADSICRFVSKVQWIQGSEIAMVNVNGIEANISRQRITLEAQRKEDEIAARLVAIGQIFPKLLAGLDRLILIPGGGLFTDRVVYTYNQIFEVLLQRVCDVATTRAKERLAEPQGRELASTGLGSPPARGAKDPCSACIKRNLKCEARRPKCRNCSRLKHVCRSEAPASSTHTTVENPMNLPFSNQIIKLCELEIAMLGSLDVGNQIQAKVLQGFLCILFEKVGQGLKRFVFGLEDDGLPQQSDGNEPSKSHDRREDDEAIEAQGPYMVWILEQAESFLSRHNFSDNSNQTLSRTNVNDAAMFARNKLQNTLLKSVFGQEASMGFEPSLQSPGTIVVADLEGLNLPPVELKNWFKHEVWRIVGWDVLRNRITWD